MSLYDWLPARRRLTVKMVGVLTLHLVLALIAVGATLLLSWQLEGGAAAINDAGSMRMRTFKLTQLLSQYEYEPQRRDWLNAAVEREIGLFDQTMLNLRRGDPVRPLFLPRDAEILRTFAELESQWRSDLRPMMQRMLRSPQPGGELELLRGRATAFVDLINTEVMLIERNNATKTLWLRSSQMALIAMALLGTVAIIYLMFLMVIRPVGRLQKGIQRMAEGDFTVRLEVESRDEFGLLTNGFNQMADKLEGLYGTLENRVRQKTYTLEEKNRELACLYEIASFLSQPHSVEEMCRGFLARLMRVFGADGGAVRVSDPRRENLHLVVHQGLTETLVKREFCMHVNQCLCGESARRGTSVVHDLRKLKPGERILPCEEDGFSTVSIFQIRATTRHLGIFNLHFHESHEFSEQEMRLLQTLGDHLGIAIENIRLAAKEREMAVSEERNLMAQGLHDSIAQSLSFLNLQVQMLESAIANGETEQAQENLGFIRTGVQECYEDVRELLLNFRTRINKEDFADAVRTVLSRFEQQAQVPTQLNMLGNGLPLDPQQQLQVIFILQEALSNVRKHAKATRVELNIRNEDDFVMTIADDGCGFDDALVQARKARHVGLSIMQERAARIRASIHISPRAGSGTVVTLTLPRTERQAV